MKRKDIAEKVRSSDVGGWNPKTRLGKRVKAGEVTSMQQVLETGQPILEPEITDTLLSDLESVTIQVKTTQRVTDSGKRTQFRIVVVIGDRKGHVGVGVGKNEELRPALENAIRHAKKKIIFVPTACGSWECKCSVSHSLPQRATGKEGSSIVVLKPAPRGLGLAANHVVKKVLAMAGVKDIWGFSSGGRNVYNIAEATIAALQSINTLKPQPKVSA